MRESIYPTFARILPGRFERLDVADRKRLTNERLNSRVDRQFENASAGADAVRFSAQRKKLDLLRYSGCAINAEQTAAKRRIVATPPLRLESPRSMSRAGL
jgi:hypothetical protein